jgi:RHS repeat-associated protein
VVSSGSLGNPFQFTGRDFDPATGLRYYRARYYDSSVGRFISEDPTGFQGSGSNFYAYAANNPPNWTDPTGLLCWIPNDIRACIEKLFGTPIDKIKIRVDIKPPDYAWNGTTRRNKIIIFIPCQVFFQNPYVYLEEYYHVIEQWNKGRVSRIAWLWAERHGYDNNKYENEAKDWVKKHIPDFQDCIRCKAAAPSK